MQKLSHSAGHGDSRPQGRKDRPFRLFEAMRERRYERLVQKIESVDGRLHDLGEKRYTFTMLVKSSKASVVEPDMSNWDEAMSSMRTCESCRKTLKTESRSAALKLFSRSMWKVGAVIGAWAVTWEAVRSHMPAMSSSAPFVFGALIVGAAAAGMAAWASVSAGAQDFLDALSANLDKQQASLREERRQLMKKMYRSGFRESR